MNGSDTYERIKVAIRCRPLSEDEVSFGCTSIVNINSRNEVEIKDSDNNDLNRIKRFTFNAVFGEDCEQHHVYEETVRQLVDSVLQGFNSTIFVYGQSGSGKTYTMDGNHKSDNGTGIIPRAMLHIFDSISKSFNVQYLVRVAYLEIYKDEIRDLLRDEVSHKCVIKESKDSGIYVSNLRVFVCNNLKQVNAVVSAGRKRRTTGHTNLNDKSSRSHAVLTITIEMKDMVGPMEHQVRVGKLNLVDLAGSERQLKSNAQGTRLEEANKINLSLSSLGKVISALTSNQALHIPYRDSKLTRLLSDSLGGNSKTLMIANIGPADINYNESLSTLRFASRVSVIKNKPKINEDPTDALLRVYQEEITRLKAELRRKNSEKIGKHAKTNLSGVNVTGSHDRSLKPRFDQLNYNDDNNSSPDLVFDQECLNEVANRLALMESKIVTGVSSIFQQTNKQQLELNKMNSVIKESIEREKDMQEILELESGNTEEMWNELLNLFIEVSSKRECLKNELNKLEIISQKVIREKNKLNVDRQESENKRHQLVKSIKLKLLILENFVPLQDRRKILQKLHYDNDVESWKVMHGNSPGESLSRLKSVDNSRRPFTTYSTISLRKAEYMYQSKQSFDWENQVFRYKSENILSLSLTYLPTAAKLYVPPTMPRVVDDYIRNALHEEDDLDIDAGYSGNSQIAKRKSCTSLARGNSEDPLSLKHGAKANEIKQTSLIYPKARGLLPHKIFTNMI